MKSSRCKQMQQLVPHNVIFQWWCRGFHLHKHTCIVQAVREQNIHCGVNPPLPPPPPLEWEAACFQGNKLFAQNNAALPWLKADSAESFIAASKWTCVVSGFDVNLPFQPVVACLTGSSHTEKKTAPKLSRRNAPPSPFPQSSSSSSSFRRGCRSGND